MSCRTNRCRFIPGDVVSLGINGLLMHVTDAKPSGVVCVSWWSGLTMYHGRFEAGALIHRLPVKKALCVCERRR